MEYPLKMRVVTKMTTIGDEKYIEVLKYSIPHPGDITIVKNGDIHISNVDKDCDDTVIREDEGKVDTFDTLFLTKEKQGSIAKAIGKASVKAAVGATITAALI